MKSPGGSHLGGATEIYIESFVKGNFRLTQTGHDIVDIFRHPARLDGRGEEEEAGGIMRNVDREREREREREVDRFTTYCWLELLFTCQAFIASREVTGAGPEV